MRRHLIALVLGLTLLAPPAWGLEIGGVTLPETLTLDGQTLVLNGAGLRKKFFVKVYAGGLYLTEKSRDAAEIIDADAPMVIRMHFIYDGISPEKLKGTWNEGFDNATGGNTAPLKKAIDEFNGLFTEEVKEGDVYDLIYRPGGGVFLEVGGKAVGRVPGLDFKRALFGIWLGDKPADKGLKRGMLGRD
jgi:hypothetical protein